MANRTVTVTVASGTLYVVGGTGNSFYIDGTRPGDFTVDWVKDGTIRFEQSGSSNDGHPLIFSTSNSSTLGTMQAGIISSGVTYYLDGSSNQSDYTNTTTFNAATTRYIEIAPASQTDFYFACWVHGIQMGGIMDLLQDSWGAMSWGDNAWNSSNNLINATAQVLTVSTGTVEAFNLAGWGRLGWGDNEWGDSGLTVDVSVTGQALTAALASVTISAELNSGWGRAGWGEDGWGIQGDVLLTGQALSTAIGTLNVTTDVTQGWGRQSWGDGVWGKPGTVVDSGDFALAATLGTETVTGDGLVIPTGIALTTSLGDETAVADVVVSVTGQSIATSTGTLSMAFGIPVTGQVLTTSIGKGWGASTWGAGIWGGLVEVSLSPVVIPTTQVITTTLGTETVTGNATVSLTGLTTLSTSIGTETIAIGQQVDVTGQSIATTLASATVTTEVNIGWGRQTWGYGQWGDAGIVVALTGQAMTLALGNESTKIDVAVTAATQSLTVSLGTAVAGASADVTPTGQDLTTYTGTLITHIWTEIDPGVSMVWTEIAA